MAHILRIVESKGYTMESKIEHSERTRSRSVGIIKSLASVFMLTLLFTNSVHVVTGRSHQFADDRNSRNPAQGGSAPQITHHPPSEVAYKDGELVKLQCSGVGSPAPLFRWEKDGININESGLVGVRMVAEDGGYSLQIDSPEGDYDGFYQCFANNIYGTAVSTKSRLQKAETRQFPQKDVEVHNVIVGQPLILKCNPPYSYPKPVVYWGETQPKIRPVDTDDRVSHDYNGNLYFANVNASDSRNGREYACLVTNSRASTTVHGDNQLIKIQKVTQPVGVAPQLMWYSAAEDNGKVTAVKGHLIKMKCIFSGYPTPTVTFTRIGGELKRHMLIPDDSHGSELLIEDVQSEDEGTYRCTAVNSASKTPVSQDFQLLVESSPHWKDQRPQDLNVDEGEGAEFQCMAGGLPPPTVSWLVNGAPLNDDPRRTVTEHSLTYVNTTSDDNQVIQCNATNVHGSLFANVHLFIRSEPPTFLKMPASSTKVLEGQDANLSCSGMGAPRPYVSWYKGGYREDIVYPLDIQNERSLHIEAITPAHEGEYHCQLVNKYDTVDARADLIVLKKISIISSSPQNEALVEGNDVTLICDVTADRHDNVTVTWWTNGVKIDHDEEGEYFTIRQEGRKSLLTIPHTQVADSGIYTCKVTTDQDSAEQLIKVIIRGKPGPPSKVQFGDCNGDNTELSWLKGSDNNDVILGYDISYNTSLDEANQEPRHVSLDADQLKFSVNLEPYRNYTFKVSARNSVGSSHPVMAVAAEGAGLCTSSPTLPSVNPQSVCTELHRSDQLVVTWKPLSLAELNGPGFHYLVSFTRQGVPDAVEEVRQVYHYDEGRVVVSGLPPFTLYTVQVFSANSLGTSKTEPKRYAMRSGESAPLISPLNFRVIEKSLNSSGAQFEWDPIDETNADLILGYFRGYQVKYWKRDKPDEVRSTDLILRPDPKLCPLMELESPGGKTKKKRDVTGEKLTDGGGEGEDKVSLYLTNLWSSSEIEAGVSILNGAGAGQMSDVISFTTPPGPPEAVVDLGVDEVGSFHIQLSWKPPLTDQDQDQIRGYLVTYRSVLNGGTLSKSLFIKPSLPALAHSSRLTGLESDTLYLVTVCADTQYGCGAPSSVEKKTLPDTAPDKPSILDVRAGETWANVSYLPIVKSVRPYNPASEYFVEFRKSDVSIGPYLRSSREWERLWINVTELLPGTQYDMRVVAANLKHETPSDVQSFRVGIPEPITTGSAGSPLWLIILLIIIALIILVLIIVCILYRRRGGSYPVHAKEKEKDQKKNVAKDEAPFIEYPAPSGPVTSHSQASLSGEGDTDMDSLLGEYEESEETKFNEDGSFIGVYGGKEIKRLASMEPGYVEEGAPQRTAPPAPHNTFV